MKKRNLFAILSVFFLDNFGLMVVYPIFSPLIFKSTSPLLSSSVTLHQRTLLLGILIAAFPLAQFIGAPLIGAFSDRNGIKRGFYLTIIGEALGFLLSGFALLLNSFAFLITSRIITGFFSGNLTLCLKSMARLSEDPLERSKYFGILISTVAISFFAATTVGGELSSQLVDPLFNASFPFWIGTLLSVLNLSIITRFYHENRKIPKEANSLRSDISAFWQLLLKKRLKILYISFFFFILAWIASLQFFSPFLMVTFDKSKMAITASFATLGIVWILSSLFINRIAIANLSFQRLLRISLLLMTACLIAATLSPTASFFLVAMLFASILAPIIWTNFAAYISKLAPAAMQGKVLGFSQAVTTLAMGCAPLFGTEIAGADIRLIFWLSSISLSLSSLIAIFFFYKKLKLTV